MIKQSLWLAALCAGGILATPVVAQSNSREGRGKGESSPGTKVVEVVETEREMRPGVRKKTVAPESRFSFSFDRFLGGDRPGKPMIIRHTSPPEADKAAAALQEDLAVMARILNKAAEEYAGDPERRAGIDLLLHGSRDRTIYIEDYGVLFLLEVGIPLAPEPAQDPAAESEEPADEEWNEARREVLGEHRPHWLHKGRPRPRPFDGELVAELERELIKALRNGSNIRNLPDTAWITLVVQGRGQDLEGEMPVVLPEMASSDQKLIWSKVGGTAKQSTLVLRVRKSDVNEFAKKKSGLEEFRRTVTRSVY